MQSHSVVQITLLKLSAQSQSSKNKDKASLNLNKEPVLIDLCDNQQQSFIKASIGDQKDVISIQEMSNSNNFIAASPVHRQKTRQASEWREGGNRYLPENKMRLDIKNAQKLYANKLTYPQVYDIDELSEDNKEKGQEAIKEPLRKIFQYFLEEVQDNKIEKSIGKLHTKSSSNKSCQNLTKQFTKPIGKSQIICFGKGDSLQKIESKLSISVDMDVRNDDKKIRGLKQKKELQKLDLGIDFFNREIRKSFKVAKYRYKKPECVKTIHQMVVRVSNRIHFGQNLAKTSPHPTIPCQSYKHRIFVECLRLQLNRRRFVSVDQ